MKTFNAPAMDVEKFEIMDVISTSVEETECGDDCTDDTPIA